MALLSLAEHASLSTATAISERKLRRRSTPLSRRTLVAHGSLAIVL